MSIVLRPNRPTIIIFPSSHSSRYLVRYIDLTTGRTHEKEFTEREKFDFYKLQREGKRSVISIHSLKLT